MRADRGDGNPIRCRVDVSVRFVFLIPTRNSVPTMERCLLSLAGQSYSNWRAIVTDDASTDGTADMLETLSKELGIWKKILLIRNDGRLWEVENVVRMLDETSIEDDDVCARLDLDDYLCDLNALEIVATHYAKDDRLDALWTMHRWFDSGGITTKNISGPMTSGSNVYVHPWVASHFKTWKTRLSRGVSDVNYRDASGTYFKRAGDQAIYLPALHRAHKWKFLPLATYAYRCEMRPETFETQDAKFQKEEADYIRTRGFVE